MLHLHEPKWLYVVKLAHLLCCCVLPLQSPTRMGLKLHFLTTDCSVHFVKAFWSLMEQDAVKVRK